MALDDFQNRDLPSFNWVPNSFCSLLCSFDPPRIGARTSEIEAVEPTSDYVDDDGFTDRCSKGTVK